LRSYRGCPSLWGLWIWQYQCGTRLRRGREVIAAMVSGTPAERGQVTWVSHPDGDVVSRRKLDVLVVAEARGGEAVFVDARLRTRPRPHGDLFRIDGPIWLWRSEDDWAFGQIALHGLDPTYSPADEPRPPIWVELHGCIARSISAPACLLSLCNIAPEPLPVMSMRRPRTAC